MTVFLAVIFACVTVIGARGWAVRKLMDGPLQALFFAAGAWTLLHQAN